MLSGLVAAPVLLDRMRWLRAEDFSDPGCGEVFTAITGLRQVGAPIDLLTLTAALSRTAAASASQRASRDATQGPSNVVELCSTLDPASAFRGSVEFLARRVLSTAVIAHAGQAGEDLQRLAAAPAEAGGAGEPLFAGALQRLQPLVERGERWQESRVTVRAAPAGLGGAVPGLELVRGAGVNGVSDGVGVGEDHRPGHSAGRAVGRSAG